MEIGSLWPALRPACAGRESRTYMSHVMQIEIKCVAVGSLPLPANRSGRLRTPFEARQNEEGAGRETGPFLLTLTLTR
jgi:hypothetical protein